MTAISKDSLEAAHGGSMTKGGRWHPQNCASSPKMALIIPFRDRHAHLHVLLNNLIPFLQYQQRNFRIFVIEQVSTCTYIDLSGLSIPYTV